MHGRAALGRAISLRPLDNFKPGFPAITNDQAAFAQRLLNRETAGPGVESRGRRSVPVASSEARSGKERVAIVMLNSLAVGTEYEERYKRIKSRNSNVTTK